MIDKETFVTELQNIIQDQEKRYRIEEAMSDYIKGFRFPISDVNEERAIRYLSALIGLGMDNDSPLLSWYYDPFRNGLCHPTFVVKAEDGIKRKLETAEMFYEFYCGDGKND